MGGYEISSKICKVKESVILKKILPRGGKRKKRRRAIKREKREIPTRKGKNRL